MAIRDIMTPHPAACTPTTRLEVVARLMADRDCGEIPVCQDGRVVGVITDRDIVVRALACGKDARLVPVMNVMTPVVHTVRGDDSINRAIQVMEKYRVRRLPVTEEDGSLIGMISQSDLATALPESRTGELVYEISHRNGELAHRIV